jgi:hypothetical protein
MDQEKGLRYHHASGIHTFVAGQWIIGSLEKDKRVKNRSAASAIIERSGQQRADHHRRSTHCKYRR